jgi:hypothetical protein
VLGCAGRSNGTAPSWSLTGGHASKIAPRFPPEPFLQPQPQCLRPTEVTRLISVNTPVGGLFSARFISHGSTIINIHSRALGMLPPYAIIRGLI